MKKILALAILSLALWSMSETAHAAGLSASYCSATSNMLCTTNISVYPGGTYARVMRVTVSTEHEYGEKLFACWGPNGGTQAAPWIARGNPATFHLYEAEDCYSGYGTEIDRLTVFYSHDR